MNRTVASVAIVILAALVLITVAVVAARPSGAAEPAASPSPSPSLTMEPLPEVTKAPSSTIRWARHWRRIAVSKWCEWNRARVCLGMSKRPFASPQPKRSADKATWVKAGKTWKHLVRKGGGIRTYQSRTKALVKRMTHPGGSGWERWRPLVRWIWPARCVDTVIQIMRYESGGNPRILCGGYVLPKGAGDGSPTKTAGGLMQCKPAPRHWADPFYNLWYAYHHKYIPAGGWSPWAGCRAF